MALAVVLAAHSPAHADRFQIGFPMGIQIEDSDTGRIKLRITEKGRTLKVDARGRYALNDDETDFESVSSLILAKMAKKLTNSKNVCTAGGSFLNCNSNELLNKSGLFENYFFIPPADDSGIPLGCAWFGAHMFKQVEKPKFINPYIGRKYDRQEVMGVLNANPELYFKEIDNFDELLDTVAYWLTQNRAIGWFQDGSEIGPRALGNRSIVASPMKAWMSGHINSDIKGREWYRPFAPAVLFEHQSEIFETNLFSPHMLVTTKVKDEWKDKIPSVVHIDGSARHQSVTEQTNFKFYSLIKKFQDGGRASPSRAEPAEADAADQRQLGHRPPARDGGRPTGRHRRAGPPAGAGPKRPRSAPAPGPVSGVARRRV